MNPLETSPSFDIRSFDDPMSPIEKYHDTEQFCTTDSLAASSNYINILLTSYGYPVPLVFNSTQADDQCKIVNCLYSLLQDRKSDANERQDFIYTINEMKKQQAELETRVINLKRENNTKEQNNVEIRSKLEANEALMKKNASQNTRIKEEIAKVKNSMQYMKTQYANESSRHEQELAKTQDRLVKCMNHHYKTKLASLEINSHFATTINNTADSNEVVQVHKKYADLLLKANDRERELRQESEDLRTGIVNLYAGVRRLLEQEINRFDNDASSNPRDSYNEIARFRLPMDCGGKEAIQMVEDLLVRLKEEWENQIDQKPHEYTKQDILEKDEIIQSLEDDLNGLIDTLNQTREEHEEEIKMYKRFEQGGFFDTLYPTPKDAYISDSEEEEYKYQLIKKKAMRDQKKVTQSTLELGRQRTQLEAERWAFEEMKRELQLQEILQESPSPPPTHQEPTFTFEQPERPRKRKSGWLGSAPSIN